MGTEKKLVIEVEKDAQQYCIVVYQGEGEYRKYVGQIFLAEDLHGLAISRDLYDSVNTIRINGKRIKYIKKEKKQK